MNSLIQKASAVALFILVSPLLSLLFILVKLDSRGPFIFKQKRVGKNKKIFTMYKVRTMVVNAEKIKHKYKKLNQGAGPIFKIYNDPRFTRVGRFMAHIFVDEFPQLINVAKGEMAFVGPRPLLISDVKNTPKKYDARFTILPGLTSSWNIKGRYNLTFKKWMELDVEYANKKSLFTDVRIIYYTILFMIKTGILEIEKIIKLSDH